jgi:pilus assembly protein Flp/PilA
LTIFDSTNLLLEPIMNLTTLVRRRANWVAVFKSRVPASARAAKNLLRNEDGVTAIEYALIASLIALAIVAAVSGVGTTVASVFSDISTGI